MFEGVASKNDVIIKGGAREESKIMKKALTSYVNAPYFKIQIFLLLRYYLYDGLYILYSFKITFQVGMMIFGHSST